MHPTLRFLHLLGLTLFLGSLPTHIVLGLLGPGGELPPQGVMFARTMIKVITLAVTVPGLMLLAGSGLARWRLQARQAGDTTWLTLHVGLGFAVVAVGGLVLTPVTFDLAGQAAAVVDGTFSDATWQVSKTIEDVAGAFNLIAALIAVALACYRPFLRRHRLDRPGAGA